MRGLFPAILANQTYHIERDGGHQIYVEESGSREGIAVLFCHGGPGGGSAPEHRRFFDPQLYRIVAFDQRGCGQSTPHGELKDNDLWALVEDIEHIRKQLNIDSWLVTGGSWGSTLALVYAIKYPQRVKGLILRGVFLGRQQDLHWLYAKSGGAAQLFPDYYQHFRELISSCADGDELSAYYRLLTSENEIERLNAAKTWAIWEGKISTLTCKPDAEKACSETHRALSLARLECHYFINDCFMAENYILDNIQSIADIQGFMIHGRYDAVCKIENAFTLDKYWAGGKLQVIPAAGHSGFEPALADAFCRASDLMAGYIAKVEQDK
jgi:proline iminopeptidase